MSLDLGRILEVLEGDRGRLPQRFILPVESVTSTDATLAMRGAGKSSKEVRRVERMWEDELPFVVLDPKGDWWGVQASADGMGEGLPIPIFGGDHGNLPLEPDAGAYIAELIMDQGLSCILDVSDFDSKAEQVRFTTAFGRALFAQAKLRRTPLHVVLEEADEFLPQQVGPDMTASVSIWTKIIKQGRSNGLGVSLVTQRSASLNKNALSQVDTLFIMRTTSSHDRKAIGEYLEPEEKRAITASMPKLKPGEAWVWSPHFLGETVRVQFDQRTTFDSGATPVAGKPRPRPQLAQLDLGKIREAMADAIERAEATDPNLLAKRVKELEAKLAARPAPEVVHEVEKIPFVPRELIIETRGLADRATALADAVAALSAPEAELSTFVRADAPTVQPVDDVDVGPLPTGRATSRAAVPSIPVPADGPNVRTNNAPTKLLTAAAHHPGRKQDGLAALAGLPVGKSTVRNAISTLRQAGYLVTDPTGGLQVTELGFAALGPLQALPTGPELIAYWMGRLGAAEGACLLAMVHAPETTFTKETMGAAAGYDPEKSTLRNAMSRLRTLGLASGWRLNPDFREAIR